MNDAANSPDIAGIRNAGLVLLHPFLPAMLQRLDLLATGGDGRPQLRGEHGAHAVQLLLNKLLCGLEPDFPAPPVDLGEEERVLCEQVLAAVMRHWPAVGQTSPEGLRQVFLQREGRLQKGDGKCTLAVARNPFDVLLSRLPWNLAAIRHPWMPQPLLIDWPGA
ncbi:contractile injection system tape measure protein [Janthinobacterium lividum]